MVRYKGKQFVEAQLAVFFRDIGHALNSVKRNARDPETRMRVEEWIDSLKHRTEYRFVPSSMLRAERGSIVTGENVSILSNTGKKLKNIITVALGGNGRINRDHKMSILHEMSHNIIPNEALADTMAAAIAARIGTYQTLRNSRLEVALKAAKARRNAKEFKRLRGIKEYYKLIGSNDLIDLNEVMRRDMMLRVPLMHNPFTQARNLRNVLAAERARRERMVERAKKRAKRRFAR